MAITLTSLTPSTFGWAVNGVSGDASGCETVVAAPGAGLSLYLRQVLISSGAALTVTLGAGKTGDAVTATILGPVYMAQNSTVSFNFLVPPRLAYNTALTIDTSGAGAVTVLVAGYTR